MNAVWKREPKPRRKREIWITEKPKELLVCTSADNNYKILAISNENANI